MGVRRPVLSIFLAIVVFQQVLQSDLPNGFQSRQCVFCARPPSSGFPAVPCLSKASRRAIRAAVEPDVDSAQAVSPGMQVDVDFTLARSDTGEVLDTTKGSKPLSFVCGQKQVFMGLDMAVRSMVSGETHEIAMTGSNSGFGEHDSAKVASMPVKHLPPGVHVGTKLQLQGAQGPHTARVVDLNESVAMLDFNHPLAGLPLTLTVIILGCKLPKAENTQWQAQGQFVRPRTERLEKLKAQTIRGVCAVCCKPATIRCSKCNHVLYCGKECKERHWKSLGHSETCHLEKCDFQLQNTEPSGRVDAITLSALDQDIFQEFRQDEGRPVLLRGVVKAAASETEWGLDSLATSFGDDTKLDVRFYRGVATSPHMWADVGYCDSTRTTVDSFVKLIRSGMAEKLDAYVNCDLAGTKAASSHLGNILKYSLEQIAKITGLQSTATLGDQINIWWGAPGHTEPLHCDANDGTLLQLSGRKKVVLFPASDWLNLYPFPTSAGMSWAWSRISLQDVDVKSFPNVRKALPRRYEVILEEGDALFIPACWAHQITGLKNDAKAESDAPHILSVNRFWKTDLDRSTRWLPEDVANSFRESFPRGM